MSFKRGTNLTKQLGIIHKRHGPNFAKPDHASMLNDYASCTCIRKSHLSRCSTAYGFSTGSCLVHPTRVKACKSVLFTKSSFVV